ncbi:hypothetical protein BB559_007282, partial [Furculomyces boomerangus]
MENIELKPSGQLMPTLGFGFWKVPNPMCKDIVVKAVKAGYRLLDCASDYGNEAEVGDGIKAVLDQGLITRKDLFVTSKLWCTHHRKEHVKVALKRTLADLGLDYLDLYIIHFPICVKYVPIEERYPPGFYYDGVGPKPIIDPVPYQETWQAMEELVDEGLVKNIGVSNMAAALLMDVLSYARIKPAVLQIELHPYCTRNQLVRFAQENDVAITAYSSFGDASYQSIGMVKEGKDFVSLLNHNTVLNICDQVERTPAQVLLRWAVQRGCAVIPKSASDQRI